jgi:aromatic amino acid permease
MTQLSDRPVVDPPLVDDRLVNGLSRNLRTRHLGMIGLGGVIGAGLFVGSGAGVAIAGPGILLSYVAAGVLAMIVMRLLGEMVAAYPANGAFSVHAEQALGRWAGFSLGWLYWVMLVVVLAIEATAAAVIIHSWLPSVPQWLCVLVLVVFFTVTNLASVGTYGEFEFWFAAIKVLAVIGFVGLGIAATFGWLPHTTPVGTTNLLGHGGFLPHGWSGVVDGLLAVVFSFGGMELVAIAAAEAGNPGRAIKRAVSSTVWRILLFYVGSLAVVVVLLPWNSAVVGKSPYVAVLDRIGVPAAGSLMTVVVLVALLSALNANLYGSSRMLHSLALRGEAPARMAAVSGRGVPRPAILASVTFGFVSVILSAIWPDTVFLYLADAIGGVVLVVWAMIVITHLRMRKSLGRPTGRPYLHVIALAATAAVTVLMIAGGAADSMFWTLVLIALVGIAAVTREVRIRRRQENQKGRGGQNAGITQ